MFKDKNWFFEKNNTHARGFKFLKTLFDKKSIYQNVKVIQTEDHGKMLINDDMIMTCERDEFIYHEMIAHVPLFTHPSPKKILIIGGGDGGTAREVLKHPSLEECVMVEIDSLVVEACKKYIPITAQSFDHPLLKLKFEDGAKYIAQKENFFDIVIVDSTDPIGPGEVLFNLEFYKNVNKALKPNGLVVSQGESPFYDIDIQKKLLKIAGSLFSYAGFYHYNNVTYPGGFWSFLFASKEYHPIKDFNVQRVIDSKIKFRYYSAEIHNSSFSQPQFIKEAYGNLLKL